MAFSRPPTFQTRMRFITLLLVGTSAGTGGVQTLQSYWFVKSDQLGKVSRWPAVAGLGQHRDPR